eukprot:scaffold4390_cov264-Pinguiococcus_pyrenoidosus.AAC.10
MDRSGVMVAMATSPARRRSQGALAKAATSLSLPTDLRNSPKSRVDAFCGLLAVETSENAPFSAPAERLYSWKAYRACKTATASMVLRWARTSSRVPDSRRAHRRGAFGALSPLRACGSTGRGRDILRGAAWPPGMPLWRG